jgi:hypothetical protein
MHQEDTAFIKIPKHLADDLMTFLEERTRSEIAEDLYDQLEYWAVLVAAYEGLPI